MTHQSRLISLNLPVDLLLAIGRAARAADCSASDYVRETLATAVSAAVDDPLPRFDIRLIKIIFETADGWLDLQSRLRKSGYVLRPDAEAGLVLHSWPMERALQPVSEFGHSAASLALRFRAPFPGLMPGTRLGLTLVRPAGAPASTSPAEVAA